MGGVLVSPSMVQTVGGGLLVSPSLAQPRDCTLRGAASSCRNSKTARNLRRVSVLGSAASSSRYRGANSGFGTLLESLSRFDVVLESLSWFDVLLVSQSWLKPCV